MRPTFLHHRNPVKDKRLTRYDPERRVYYVDRFKTPFIRMSACLDPRICAQSAGRSCRVSQSSGRQLWTADTYGEAIRTELEVAYRAV